jgi:cation diffusion facilitator CzcD-associated flavoprotein CzcO
MAIRFKKGAVHEFLNLERDEDVGGVWSADTYPLCACDSPCPPAACELSTHTLAPVAA